MTFGDWMIVKKYTRNGNENRQQNKDGRGKKTPQAVNKMLKSNLQNSNVVCGSRFAIFRAEEEGTNVAELGTEQMIPMEEVVVNDSGNLEQKEEKSSRGMEKQQETISANTEKQQNIPNNVRLETGTNMLKSKSIMERFVKPKEGAENKSAGHSKTSTLGTFKPQKSKKTNNQLEKTKTLIIVEELSEVNRPLRSQWKAQGEREDYILNNRPPDPIKLMTKENIKVVEEKQE